MPHSSSASSGSQPEPNAHDTDPYGPSGTSSPSDFSTTDWTEGADASEIAEALAIRGQQSRTGRRDSMSGWAGEDAGHQTSIFDGPGSYNIPSSVTSMHHHLEGYAGRRSMTLESRRQSISRRSMSSRRQSTESRRTTAGASVALSDDALVDGPAEAEGEGLLFQRRPRKADGASDDEDDADDAGKRRGGVLGGIAAAFGFGGNRVADEEDDPAGGGAYGRSFSSQRSRPSLMHRSSSRSRRSIQSEALSDGSLRSDDEGSDDNWGYSSNESDSGSSRASIRSENNDLMPLHHRSSRHPDSPEPTIPLLPQDPVFNTGNGNAYLEPSAPGRGGAAAEGPAAAFAPIMSDQAGSRQIISLPDEDLALLFVAFETVRWRELVWWLGVVLTAGVLGLVGRWVPRLWVRWVGKETDFAAETNRRRWILVETPFKDLNIIPLQSIAYPYPLSTVFPSAASPVGRSQNASSAASTNGTATAAAAVATDAKDMVVALDRTDVEAGSVGWEDTMGFLKVVDYRYTRFVLDERVPGKAQWRMVRDWRDRHWSALRTVQAGLDDSTRDQRRILFGLNTIDIEGKSVISLLLDEVLHPFYVFQVASILLWTLDDYYYYAFAIALISVSSITQTLIETKRTIERMREMSRFSCDVQTLVNGEWQVVDSSSLIPGDVFDASDASLTLVPCDAVLLSGDAIVNESMLTGESVPVSKMPIKDDGLGELAAEQKNGSTDVSPSLAQNFLFSGTKIIRVRPGSAGTNSPGGQGRALAMVVRTGFNTTKGALVRSMLFPKPMGFKFYRDSMRFIGVLGLIAGFGFLISVGKFIEIGIKWHTILVRALDLITVVVPPALPATLSIGTTFAIDRLRKLGIFCISPNRVNIGGKINVVCFDKTGTLTEEGLEVLGIRSIDKNTGRFSELHSDIAEVPPTGGPDGKTPLLYALATCHGLKKVNDEVIGDPLDVEMFDFTGWVLEEGRAGRPAAPAGQDKAKANGNGKTVERPQTLVQTVVRPKSSEAFEVEDALKSSGTRHAHFLELGVIRTFEFVSSLRRMSVIVKRLKAPSMEIYVKGAPEVMAEICDPASFPKDYEDLLSYYTKHGFRVIAIAGKSVPGLTWLKAQRMKREQAESGLNFLGLIVFENKLKPGTAPAISVLRGAHLTCRMVTGDNVRTAVSVARECGLVTQSATVFLPSFTSGSPSEPESHIAWTSVDDDDIALDEYSLRPLDTRQQTHLVDDQEEPLEYSLAVTGDVFRWMVDWAPLETFHRMLIKGVIFARMSPDEKHELVERLQELGYTVCFCGDGANDCGALKAADVGISLSEAEASVAAPFTSRVPDISCVIEVIKEGRAALVTSFSCFKYMALYSLIQFTTITLLYSFASSLGDFQFLYIDLFIIIPIAVAMGRTLPYPDLHPKRPTGSLVSKRVLTSIISQTVINAAVQISVFVLVKSQPWYEEPEVDVDKLETLNYANSALFLVSSFQYILVAAVFSGGPPYCRPIYTNYSLMICLTLLTAFSAYVLLIPAGPIKLFLDLMDLTMAFRVQLLGIVGLNVVLCFASEKWAEKALVVVYQKARNWARQRSRNQGKRRNNGKLYKSIGDS